MWAADRVPSAIVRCDRRCRRSGQFLTTGIAAGRLGRAGGASAAPLPKRDEHLTESKGLNGFRQTRIRIPSDIRPRKPRLQDMQTYWSLFPPRKMNPPQVLRSDSSTLTRHGEAIMANRTGAAADISEEVYTLDTMILVEIT